jgi:RNA polymerase sigma-70 factor (ECF subfamily)
VSVLKSKKRMTISDDIIIQQALRGEQQGFARIVEKYEQYVFTLALRIVKNREDAHEVAQDAFLKAFRYLNTFRGECKFSSWLYKIVYSTALNHIRTKRPEILSMDNDEKPIVLPDFKTEDAAFQMEINEQKRQIQDAIQELSPDYATIITLFYLFEQKISEICVTMEMNESNVKTKLSRARQRLREIIEKNYADLQGVKK